MARLRELYEKEIVPALMEKFNYKNIMEAPKLEKSWSTWGRRR